MGMRAEVRDDAWRESVGGGAEEAVGGEAVGGEAVGGEPVDVEPVDAEPVDAEPVDGEALASDARIERMERVAMLHAEITAATRSFLSALAESDRHRDWEAEGFRSCAEWLAWRLGIKRNAANERVRTARALEHLPLTSEAMARGEISYTKVRMLTRDATAATEAELLPFARAGSAENLDRFLRDWRALSRTDLDGEARIERRRHARRTLTVFPDHLGMYVVRGLLPPEVGALLMRAVDAASDALYRDAFAVDAPDEAPDGREAPEEPDAPDEAPDGREAPEEPDAPDQAPSHLLDDDAERRREAARRRADALGLIAECALAAGFGAHDGAPISGSRAERYQVMLHVDALALTDDADGATPGESAPAHDRLGRTDARPRLDDGTPVTAVTARRLACDAARVVVRHDSHGSVLDVGRRSRTVPPAIRRALEVRDRGCRFPGCGLRFTDAHHIVHWADGGQTRLGNLVLLCRRHHRSVHEGRVRVCLDRLDQVVFFTPDGRTLADAPPLPPIGAPATSGGHTTPADPANPLIRRNRARGIIPPPFAGQPLWSSDHLVPWHLEAAARDALDPTDLDAPADTDPDPGRQRYEFTDDAA